MLKDLLHLFYPNLCEGCRQPLVKGERIVCLACESQLAFTDFTNRDNETALSLWGRVPFVYAISLLYFTEDSLTQHLIHRMKYKERKPIGIYIGNLLAQQVREWKVDAVIPVPLHAKKEAKRGYNQSALIAEGIAKPLGIPVLNNVLIRTRQTETQTQKTREERIANVADAFGIHPKAKLPDRMKHLLVVDDVLTTGATIEACAGALLRLEGVRISVATAGFATR